MNGDTPHDAQEEAEGRRNVRRRHHYSSPSAGARLKYSDLGDAVDPPVEEFNPEIRHAILNPAHIAVVSPTTGLPAPNAPPIHILPRDNDAERAYALIAEKPSKKLSHHGPNWGEVLFGVMYRRSTRQSDEPVFWATTEDGEVEYVAIKKLNKCVVDASLLGGGEENPYKEIDRMVELGDDVHVLSCLDALQDDNGYLYIITRLASGGPLNEAIDWNSPDHMELPRIKSIFTKILQILVYLEKHGICHRDLSPDNFLFLTPENLVVFDLALSHRIPVDLNGQRCRINPIGNFGTHAWMAPEVYSDREFCGVYSDVWSGATILYNLLTNKPLYFKPHPSDALFRFNILAGAISNTGVNEMAMQVLYDASHEDQVSLFNRAIIHSGLDPDAIELLGNLLAMNVSNRWSLAEALHSNFVQSHEAG